jgi:phenylacetate-CoA ligase
MSVFPSAIEEVVRAFEEIGDEFQIVIETDGVMDALTIVAETIGEPVADSLRERIAAEILRRCEIRPRVELVAPDTLPKTEFKARRVIDRRGPAR